MYLQCWNLMVMDLSPFSFPFLPSILFLNKSISFLKYFAANEALVKIIYPSDITIYILLYQQDQTPSYIPLSIICSTKSHFIYHFNSHLMLYKFSYLIHFYHFSLPTLLISSKPEFMSSNCYKQISLWSRQLLMQKCATRILPAKYCNALYLFYYYII
jgi:hypothetical protein